MSKPNCRWCNAESFQQSIRAEYVFGGKSEHKFWECGACGLVYLWPIPSEEEEKYFYAQEFEKFMSSRTSGDRDWSGPEKHISTNQDHVHRRMKYIEKELDVAKNILEIGCSSGFMMDAFRDRGMHCVGIEPSNTFLEFLRHKKHVAFSSLDELREKMPEKKFDIIVSFFVLEHIRDTAQFIQSQLDMLTANGVIIAEVPCVNDPLTSLYKIPAFERFYWSIAHHYYFSPKSLSAILDSLDCQYYFLPEQRYDLSNHLVWMMEGRPGGQKRFSHVFSQDTIDRYCQDLKTSWHCDTFFVYIRRK
jgi:SAM-dependent methyltransferase